PSCESAMNMIAGRGQLPCSNEKSSALSCSLRGASISWYKILGLWVAAVASASGSDLVEYRGGITLGYGYNALTGEFTGPCFQGDVVSTFYDSPRGTFLWEEVE